MMNGKRSQSGPVDATGSPDAARAPRDATAAEPGRFKDSGPLSRRAFVVAGLSGAAWIAGRRRGQAAEKRLSLFIWSEYLDPAIVRDFESLRGCKVVVDVYEDAESMLAKIQGGGARYDVVVPPDYLVPAMIQLGLLAELRADRIPNLANLDPRFTRLTFDRGNRHTVPFQWGTLGVYLRPRPGMTPEETWGVFFDSAKAPGRFVLIDSMRDLIGAALKFRGLSLNTSDPGALRPVRDLLVETRKRSRGFDGSVGGRNKVLGKTVDAAMVYSGEGVRGMEEDASTVYFVPREGSQMWLDNLAVLRRAPERDLAEEFLNHILDAKVGARVAAFSRCASPNRASRPFLRAEDLANPAIYPSAERLARLEFLEDLGAKTRILDELWTQVKTR